MSHVSIRGTLLDLPLIQERYGRAFFVSIAIHILLLAFFVAAPLFMPALSPIRLGTGPGGGSGGESYVVGVADDLGGGEGLIKPATTAQPPALPAEKPAAKEIKKEEAAKAVPMPDAAKSKSSKQAPESTKATKKAAATTTPIIPVAGAKGAGGSGGAAGGSGGGVGGGSGVSIGSGSGGMFDSWYARAVEARIGQAWIKPADAQQRIEIVYSFVVRSDGRIEEIKKEKSSGNEALDLTAYRAIWASNPLAPPPPELRGQPLQFICQFVYPPDKQSSASKE